LYIEGKKTKEKNQDTEKEKLLKEVQSFNEV
jgi:hypothetical protein